VTCGVRQNRQAPFVRRISSLVANRVRSGLAHQEVQGVGGSLRRMKAECVAGLGLYDGMHRLLRKKKGRPRARI